MLRIRRVYDPPAPEDGYRVLVDRLWPRGMKREEARLDVWLKDIAPSNELRKWAAGEEASFAEFARRYREELSVPDALALLDDLRDRAREGAVTLLFAKANTAENNATVLRDVLIVRPRRHR